MTDRIADPADVLDERLRSIIALASDARADMGRRPAALEHAADACPESQGGCPRPQDKWYVVACRLAFDEEDSYYDFQAASEAKAVRMAERQIREDADEPHEEGGGRDFFVNCVIATVDKPIINHWRVAVQCASQMLMDAEDAIAPCASCGDRCAPRPDGSCPACMNAEHEPIDAEKGGR